MARDAPPPPPPPPPPKKKSAKKDKKVSELEKRQIKSLQDFYKKHGATLSLAPVAVPSVKKYAVQRVWLHLHAAPCVLNACLCILLCYGVPMCTAPDKEPDAVENLAKKLLRSKQATQETLKSRIVLFLLVKV